MIAVKTAWGELEGNCTIFLLLYLFEIFHSKKLIMKKKDWTQMGVGGRDIAFLLSVNVGKITKTLQFREIICKSDLEHISFQQHFC